MLFRYIGAGDDPPVRTTVFGIDFRLNGDCVDVLDPGVVAKLSGNASFAAESVPDAVETDALRARLEALGVKADGRWGAARLRRELEAISYGED